MFVCFHVAHSHTILFFLCLVKSGGELYVYFLQIHAAAKVRRFLKKEMKEKPRAWFLSDEDERRLANRYYPAFFMWVIYTLSHRGVAARRQQFYITSVMVFRGFSRRGVGLFAKFNYTMPVRQFDEYRKKELALEASMTQ